MNSNLLRKLPKVDELLKEAEIQAFAEQLPTEVITDKIREVLEEKRKTILAGDNISEAEPYAKTLSDIVAALSFCRIKSLRRTINATGVVLHTNLGRANLSDRAVAAVGEIAGRYSTLEYDPEQGKRGSRHVHTEELIKKICGAEAAMVVNNNAAATMLCLAALGRGKEIIVSRGELVEIGGSFRVPEIMEESGTRLVEVGTTNKTKLSDYEQRINENTAALMKVHTSNYKIIGFTEETTVRELKQLGSEYGLPVIYDLGSGLMVNLEEYGIKEPTVFDAMKEGADIVLFSGDKLLGGPQGGVIVGKKLYLDMMKKHPLARVLRVDKMTLAAMQATFEEYLDREKCKENIPVLSMLTADTQMLRARAEYLRQLIDETKAGFEMSVIAEAGRVGGGSAPDTVMNNIVLTLTHPDFSPNELAEELRRGELPIIVRIHDGKTVLDVRSLFDEELPLVARKLSTIVFQKKELEG